MVKINIPANPIADISALFETIKLATPKNIYTGRINKDLIPLILEKAGCKTIDEVEQKLKEIYSKRINITIYY